MSWCLYPHTSCETCHSLGWEDFEAVVPLECCLCEALKETFLGLSVGSIFFLWATGLFVVLETGSD